MERFKPEYRREIRQPRSSSLPQSRRESIQSDSSPVNEETDMLSSKTAGFKSGRKLAARLRKLLRKPREHSSSESVSPMVSIVGQPGLATDGLRIPPLPRSELNEADLLESRELKYVGTRDQDKSATKAYPNAVFGNRAAHLRQSKFHPSTVEEPEPHSDETYRKHHLPIIDKHLNSSHHRHPHHHGKTTQKASKPRQKLSLEETESPMWTRSTPDDRRPHRHSTIQYTDNGQTLRPSGDSQATLNGTSERTTRGALGGSRQSGINTLSVAFADEPRSNTTTNTPSGKPNETGGDSRGPSRFRQFLVESFISSRARTKSENQAAIQRQYGPNHILYQSSQLSQEEDIPPHAHTVIGGSAQATSLLRRLTAYTSNISSPPSEQISIPSGNDSLRRYTHLTVPTGGRLTFGSIASVSLGQDKRLRRPKSPRSVIGRLLSVGNASTRKSSDDIFTLPDPSKLPKVEPISSLEFTKTKLKDPKKISQKFQTKSGFDVLRRKRAGSLSGGTAGVGDRRSLVSDPSSKPKSFLLDHLSKSEETLLTMAGAFGRQALILTPHSSSTSTGPPSLPRTPNQRHHHHHHHHHHRWHRHGNHGHHRNRGHFGRQMHPLSMEAHTMTRVTESRRYLMFTRSMPFWSAKQYMEAHGTGLGDSETYALLFQHTPCYELIPDSAKLVILDSQLTISKAFEALLYNCLQAAPVWNSSQQTITAMMTITDFVNMLNMCWSTGSDEETDDKSKPARDITDFDVLTIQRWKEYTRGESLSRANKPPNNITIKHRKSSGPECILAASCPTSNPSSPSNSRSPSVSSSSSSSTSSAASLPPDLSTIPVALDDDPADSAKALPSPTSDGFLQSYGSSLIPQHSKYPTGRLISMLPEDSIFKATRMISRFRIHHLPVIDCPNRSTGNILYTMTPHRLLSYLYSKIPHLPQPRFLQSSLLDLNVGVHGRIATVTLSTTLRDAVRMFAQEQVSSFPVVDSLENKRLVNLFSKFDITTLVLTGAYNNPQMTIKEWFESCKTYTSPPEGQPLGKPPVEVCLASNNLLFVIERLVKTGLRHLIIVNNTVDYRVEGVVTLSDVLRFVIIQQSKNLSLHARQPSVAEVADEHEHESNNSTHLLETSDTDGSQVGRGWTNPRRGNKVRVTSPPRTVPPEDANAISQQSTSFEEPDYPV